MNGAVETFKRFAAMSDHRPGECGQRFLRNLDRAGSEKFVVRNHRK